MLVIGVQFLKTRSWGKGGAGGGGMEIEEDLFLSWERRAWFSLWRSSALCFSFSFAAMMLLFSMYSLQFLIAISALTTIRFFPSFSSFLELLLLTLHVSSKKVQSHIFLFFPSPKKTTTKKQREKQSKAERERERAVEKERNLLRRRSWRLGLLNGRRREAINCEDFTDILWGSQTLMSALTLRLREIQRVYWAGMKIKNEGNQRKEGSLYRS